MARERKPMEDLNAQAKQAVEETKEQALGAADTYFDFLNKTVASFPSGGTDFGEKLKSYAEKNIAATHEFIKQLSGRRTFKPRFAYRPSLCMRKCRLLGSRQRVSPRHL